MRQALRLHPDSRSVAAKEIDVDIRRPRADQLVLRFVVSGNIRDLRLPPVQTPARTDELWLHTCFEVFIGAPPGTAYYEFNFAPSTQWAAYRFSGYRSGMIAGKEMAEPHIAVQANAESFALQATLELDGLPGLPSDATWRVGLSAVIEEMSGGKSYWALAHAPGKADFHHHDGFVLDLAREQ